MSKIALLASEERAVLAWRRASNIHDDAAVWIRSMPDVGINWPIVSILCLTGWDSVVANHVIRSEIERRIAAMVPPGSDERLAREPDVVPDFHDPEEAREREARRIPVESVLGGSAEQERMLREFGISPALIGMLSDIARNSLCSSIAAAPDAESRRLVELVARNMRMDRPWAIENDLQESNDALIARIESFVGAHMRGDFLNMSRDRLEQCVRHARIGLSAQQLAADPADGAEISAHRMATINRLVAESNEEHMAGFIEETAALPSDGVFVDSLFQSREGRTYEGRPAVRRGSTDPLRDHLRDYMRSAAAENAERRSRRTRDQ